MQIFVWLPNGIQLMIEISEDATLADLENAIKDRRGFEISDIVYIFKAKKINWRNNKGSLQSLGIREF